MPAATMFKVSERRICDCREARYIDRRRLLIEALVVVWIQMSHARAYDHEIDSAKCFHHRLKPVCAIIRRDVGASASPISEDAPTMIADLMPV